MYSHRMTLTLMAVIVCLFTWMLPLAAQNANGAPPAAKSDTFLNNADLAVLGTVTAIALPKEQPESKSSLWPGGGPSYAQMTLKIDKVLIGKHQTGDIVTLPLQCMYSNTQNGMRWVPEITTNKPMLYAFRREQGGYALTAPGDTAMRPAEELPKWEAILAAMPVRISAPQVQGSIIFGEKTKITITVKNPSDKEVKINNMFLQGFYLSKRLDTYVALYDLKKEDISEGMKADFMPRFDNPLVLAPKSEKELTIYVKATPPSAWRLFEPDCLLITPVAFHVVAHLDRPREAGRMGPDAYNSPLCLTNAGYAVPKID